MTAQLFEDVQAILFLINVCKLLWASLMKGLKQVQNFRWLLVQHARGQDEEVK